MFQHNFLFLMYKTIITILIPLNITFSQQNEKLINTCGKLLSYQNRMTEVSTLSEMQEKIDISYYNIDISIDIESEQISGNVFLSGSVGFDQPDSIELDLSNSMIVDSIYVNSLLSVFIHDGNKIKIPTPEETLQEGYDFNVQIFYHGQPTSTGFGSFNFDTYNGIPHLWTLSEPYGARDWWPCKDDPSDKVDSLEISVTLQEDQIVVSNGLLIQEISVGNNLKKYTWFESYPISTYLVSITSYPYTVWHDEYIGLNGDTLPLDFYVYPDHYEMVHDNYLLTKDMMKIFAEKFGEYPFMNEKYGHAEFGRGGGMEHQTISSMGGYSEWLIAHELGHQWWGDLVTCSDFHHIWLNEGFARFSEAIWVEASNGPDAYKNYWSNHTYYGSGSIYVEDPSTTSQIFNGNLTYNKAGWVVHMLRGVLGDSLFFESLQSYAYNDSLAYDAVTTEDFKLVCENVSGLELDSFFEQWIYGEFYPKYSLAWEMNNGNQLQINISQFQNWQFFEMPIEIDVFTDLDTFRLKVDNHGLSQDYFINSVNGIVQRVELDPENWILKEVQYLTTDNQLPVNSDLIMYPAYPNPFNPVVNVNYFIPEVIGEFQSRIFIYNLSGALVEELDPVQSYPGLNKISWDASDQASGVYFLRVKAESRSYTQKIQLIK